MNLKPVLFGVTIGIALYAGLLAADCKTVCAAPLAILVGIWYFCIAAGCAASANRDAVQGKVARDYHLDNIRNEAGYNATDWSKRHED